MAAKLYENKVQKAKLPGRKPFAITEELQEMLIKVLPLYEDYNLKAGSYGDEESPISGINNDDQQVIMDKNIMAWYRQGNSYFPTKKPNQEAIPAGLYDIEDSYELGLYITRRNVMLDELFMMPDEAIMKVTDDLNKFLANEEKYKEYGMTYKRGVLFFGPPGTGKTSTSNLIIQKVIKDYGAIVLNVERLGTFIPMVRIIRALEPTKLILAVIEDLDGFIYNNSERDFLNVLDGNMGVNKICYLASTNYLNRLPPRLINRPSRFDLIVEIGYPNDIVRKTYITKKLKPVDLQAINIDKWVKDTAGLTISHIKELIISVAILGNDYTSSLSRLKNMVIDE